MPLPSRFFFFLLKTNKPGLWELFCCFWRLQEKNCFKAPAETSPSWVGWKNLCTLLASKSQLVSITAVQAWWLVSAQGPPSAPAPFCRAISHTASGLFVLTRSKTFFLSFTKPPLISPGGFSKLSRFWILTLFSRKFSTPLISVSFASVMKFHSRNFPTVHHFWGGHTGTDRWGQCVCDVVPYKGISPGRNPRATTQCTGWGWWGYHANVFCLQWAAAFCHSTITKIIQISCRAAVQPSMREKTHR